MKEKTRNTLRRFLSLLLAAAVSIAGQAMPVMAETTETSLGQPVSTAEGSPSNPVHHCVKDDTDWSYVYFGSYPQTEVTGDSLIPDITEASYNENGDAWVDGVKYRRISKSDINNDNNFGDAQYRYFKWEQIKWRVLKNDGSTLFLAADRGLDCKNYNDDEDFSTWETCTLRSWLNSEFYSAAFSDSEQAAIVTQNVTNDNSADDEEGGSYTRDNIYLLSIEEAANPEYGFCEDEYAYSASRKIQASDYAHARGGEIYFAKPNYGNSWRWWLRSPGYWKGQVESVTYKGYVTSSNVNYDSGVCVPVLHINLSSDLGSVTNPVHHCAENDATEWCYVYFGSYPQTEVTGDALLPAITEASYDENGDAWVDGIKYRRISKDDTNHSSYFGDSQYRYFKWERIKWRVLENDGSTLFLMADKGLDCKNFNNEKYGTYWENCALRSWLNKEFYGTAFSSSEQKTVKKNKENDNVFLLSSWEVANSEYGFCEDSAASSTSRRIQASDYAHARGGQISADSIYKGNSRWWLQSVNNLVYIPDNVNGTGRVDGSDYEIAGYICESAVCVPALHINLSSDLWFLTDDGTSGEGGNGGTSEETCQHTWNAGEETTKPTCTNKGTKTYACTSCGETKTEEIPATGHQHTEIRNQKNSTCAIAGYTGDKYCKDCQKVIETGKALAKAAHQYAETVTAKATPSKDGSIVKKCAVCGETSKDTTIARIQSVTLNKTKYVYNKKAQKPAVTVKDSNGTSIDSKFYTVEYKDNQNIGQASLTVQLKGNYEGTVTKTFQIVPKATKITKVAATAKGFKVTWKKQKESTTGYQLQYSTSKKFTKKTTKAKTVKKASATKLTVKKLKAEKKYYVRIRTYKTVKGKKYYSSWSKAKSVKTGR